MTESGTKTETKEAEPVPDDWIGPAVERVAATIIAHADELTELDSAIGDGDHGHNLRRGWQAVLDRKDELAGLAPAAALKAIGMTMVTKVGGASGPLYGSLFLDAAKAWDGPASVATASSALSAGVAAVKRRGKSEAGEKTMLDVLVPVAEALADADGANPAAAARAARAAAEAGLAATRDMRATKGRAAYLGERSVGHLDPGARSSTLMVETICALVCAEDAP